MTNAEIAESCLRSFWRSDFDGACRHLSADAQFWFARSLGYPTPSPARQALRNIIDDMYPKFEPTGGFNPVMKRIISEGDDVWLNYVASGTLKTGAAYSNEYVMCVVVRDGKIVRMQPFTDTLYLTRLFSGEAID